MRDIAKSGMMMSKRRWLMVIVCLIAAVLTNIYVFEMVRPDPRNGNMELGFSVSSDHSFHGQVYYSESGEFSEEKSEGFDYDLNEGVKAVALSVPVYASFLRFDSGDVPGNVCINDICLNMDGERYDIDISGAIDECALVSADAGVLPLNMIDKADISSGAISFEIAGADPYFVLSVSSYGLLDIYASNHRNDHIVHDIMICVAIDLLLLFMLWKYRKFIMVPRSLYHDRSMIWDLTKNDFQARFAGSYFGVLWAFLQPTVTMLLYWFVFQVGLRIGNVSNYPFVLYLMSGMIPWFYIQDALASGTNVLPEYNYLVKKVVFEVDILPVIKVISALFVHLFFVVFILVICSVYGFYPDLYTLQLFYYIAASMVMVLGFVYLTSACTAFFKDMSQVITIILNIGIWATPIMWNAESVLSPVMLMIFRLNPAYYIVDGFRDALLEKVWFWDKPVWTIYFWCVTILIYFVGLSVFTRLKPHFADVL